MVMRMFSAWRALYQISGTMWIAFVKNEPYYGVDRGMDIDIFLTKVRTFNDSTAKKLTRIIINLYR